MKTLNVKIESKTLEFLERLVKKKAYKNKSEAVRKILEDHFKKHPELFGNDELEPILKKADLISDKKFVKIAANAFRGTRTAAQLVAEGRER